MSDPVKTIRVAAADLNGHPRGKRLPADYLDKLASGAARLPFSALNVDVFGADIADSPLLFETGDADGILLPTARGPVPMPWLEAPTLFVPMTLHHDDGTPFAGDPRHALATTLARFAARGWSVIAATELEFTLVEAGPPLMPARGMQFEDVLSLRALDAFDPFFTDLYAGAEAMGIPAQAAISEGGIGQFEINITHADAMDSADNTWLFKELVMGMARKHGMQASFMAKPFLEDAGNGMHVHFSVVDGAGKNVFDDGSDTGSDTLTWAVAGCLAAMPASTLVFAPHRVSYDRFVDQAHAPTAASWGYENRSAAIRIPGGAPAARRIEHRVAGGDINPYLLFAAILGAAMDGIDAEAPPPPAITGSAYGLDLPGLAGNWRAAIDLFDTDAGIAGLFPADLIRNLTLCKRQELARTEGMDRDALIALYL